MRSLLLAVLTSAISVSAFAAPRVYPGAKAAGVIIGEPTALSGKYWLEPDRAIDGALGFGFGREGGLYVHSDYLFHTMRAYQLGTEVFNLFYGPGVRAKFGEKDFRMGIRGAFGTSYYFRGAPLEVFAELGPIFDLSPGTEFSMTGGIGLRYTF